MAQIVPILVTGIRVIGSVLTPDENYDMLQKDLVLKDVIKIIAEQLGAEVDLVRRSRMLRKVALCRTRRCSHSWNFSSFSRELI